MLHVGRTIPDVIASAFGSDSSGRAWQQRMREVLDALPTHRSRRRVLAHFLRWFSFAVRHGSQWRVVGASGFTGHKTELGVHPRTGEVDVRVHVPASRKTGYGRAGGLAAHEHRCPRQLDRYRRHLRGATRDTERGKSSPDGIVACEQPGYHRSDAKVPKRVGSKWAYGQAWLQLPPSAEMLSRWGKKRPSSSAPPPDELDGLAPPPRPHSDPYGYGGGFARDVRDLLAEFDQQS